MKSFLLALFLFTTMQIEAQTGLSFPYFYSFPEEDCYIKSIPHASQSLDTIGRTEIYSLQDSALIYTVNRYFSPYGFLAGNKGNNLCYLVNSSYNYPKDNRYVLFIYDKDKVIKKFRVSDLISENPGYTSYNILYHDDSIFDWINRTKHYHTGVDSMLILANEHPYFIINKVLYLITRDMKVITINIKNGKLMSRISLKDLDLGLFKDLAINKLIKPEYECPGTFSMPDLLNGVPYDSALADYLGFKTTGVYRPNDGLKYYGLKTTLLINSSGKCEEAFVEFEEKSMENKIKDFLLNASFDSLAVPKIIEKWYFKYGVWLRKSDENTAREEGRMQREKDSLDYYDRIKKDTLNGIYIPADMNDCFLQLDKILTDNEKKEMMTSDPIDYHFGLGLWIRNNWGLWKGSRLKVYFDSKGIYHPDDISGEILQNYIIYLNKGTIESKYN